VNSQRVEVRIRRIVAADVIQHGLIEGIQSQDPVQLARDSRPMSSVVLGTPHPAEKQAAASCAAVATETRRAFPPCRQGGPGLLGERRSWCAAIPSCPARIHEFELQRFPQRVERLLSYRGISDPGVVKGGSRPETRQGPGWEDRSKGMLAEHGAPAPAQPGAPSACSETTDSGLLSSEHAAGIRRMNGVEQLGQRSGNWLVLEQVSFPLENSNGDSLR